MLNTEGILDISELLEDATVLLQNFTIDFTVVRRYLRVKIRILYSNLQIVSYCKGCNFIRKIPNRVKRSNSERILDDILFFVCILV